MIGYGISMDVENLTFAVLDRDQTSLSQSYAHGLSGSRYFIEQAPLRSYEELDRRMRAGRSRWPSKSRPASAAMCKRPRAAIGAWFDGAMPHARKRSGLCARHAPAVAERAGTRTHGPQPQQSVSIGPATATTPM